MVAPVPKGVEEMTAVLHVQYAALEQKARQCLSVGGRIPLELSLLYGAVLNSLEGGRCVRA